MSSTLSASFAICNLWRWLETKTKIYEKNLLLQILAVIGRYGPHLMIVMIFVTQNNFLNVPGISDHLFGFYQTNTYIYMIANNNDITKKKE